MKLLSKNEKEVFNEIINIFDLQKFISVTTKTVKISDILKDVISKRYILCEEQRLNVWNNEQKSSLISSCIFDRFFINSNINNNIIAVKKYSGGQALLVDGQQRISTFLSFFSNSNVKASEFDNYTISQLINTMKNKSNKLLMSCISYKKLHDNTYSAY